LNPGTKGLKHTARLFNKAPTKAYKDGWDRLFGKKKKEPALYGQCVGDKLVWGGGLDAVKKLAGKLKAKP
jgi:hypothetical protein